MERLEFRAMGSRILAVVDGGGESAREALLPVPGWFEEWEAALSRFRPQSELVRLNESRSKNTAVSRTMGAVVGAALRAAEETDGLVNPLVLDAVAAAGYDHSFDPSYQPGAADHPAGIEANSDWRAVRLDRARRRIRIPRGGGLDLGGIAKGWAADTAAARLARTGPALVDAGGDISACGRMADGSSWPIGVTNPFFPGTIVCTIALAGGGVATSGRDYRKWIRDGRPRHHIIDPRTGEPAVTDVLTATVIASSARRAEAAAKAALILGSQQGLAWLERRPGLAGMLILDDRRILYSRRFADFLWRGRNDDGMETIL